MRLVRRHWVLGATVAAAMLSGCATDEYSNIETGSVGEPLGVLGGSPSAEDVAQGRKFFGAGSYGLAEQHFRRAVEANPNSVSAWVGLAASYDQLKRYDLADKAYQRALSLHGRQPLLLNNYGYHYLLRGNKGAARKILREAERKAPDDPAIQHNLALLENWSYADQFDGVPEKPRKFDRR
jgi:Flp pilus assembly protein TadD